MGVLSIAKGSTTTLFTPPLHSPLPFSDRMPSRFADNNHLLCHPWGERVYFWQQVDNPLMLHDPPMMKFPAKYVVIHEISNCASIILLSVSMHGWPMSIQDRNCYMSLCVCFLNLSNGLNLSHEINTSQTPHCFAMFIDAWCQHVSIELLTIIPRTWVI